LLIVSACTKPTIEEEVRRALPSATAVEVKVPGGAARAANVSGDVGSVTGALLGQTAEFYAVTRNVSVSLNAGAAFVLLLVHAIVAFPVTSVEGETYIWGPWHEALSPAEYRLTVREDADAAYVWSLEGRKKGEGGAPFQSVVSGVAVLGAPGHGSGSFHMDFDRAEALDPVGNDANGTLDVTYDLESEPRRVVMDHVGKAQAPGGEERATFHYEYAEARDGSGDFQFAVYGDLDDNGSAWEHSEIRSRWQETGSGRSDFRVVGGDLGDQTLTGSECWDVSFGRVYWTDSLGWQPSEGDAASCAPGDALFPASS
jgi:hypothetical protein